MLYNVSSCKYSAHVCIFFNKYGTLFLQYSVIQQKQYYVKMLKYQAYGVAVASAIAFGSISFVLLISTASVNQARNCSKGSSDAKSFTSNVTVASL